MLDGKQKVTINCKWTASGGVSERARGGGREGQGSFTQDTQAAHVNRQPAALCPPAVMRRPNAHRDPECEDAVEFAKTKRSMYCVFCVQIIALGTPNRRWSEQKREAVSQFLPLVYALCPDESSGVVTAMQRDLSDAMMMVHSVNLNAAVAVTDPSPALRLGQLSAGSGATAGVTHGCSACLVDFENRNVDRRF